jgi:hypothetical protein
MQSSYVVEEEMVKLAEEMSLMDEFDLKFNPDNLNDTKYRLRVYEDIVDEHLGIKDREDEDSGCPITDSQVRVLFYGNDGDDFFSRGSSVASISNRKEKDSSRRSSDRLFQPRRMSSRGREQKIKDTVQAICRSLKWYQSKIVSEIEATSEVITLLLCHLVLIIDHDFCPRMVI